MTTQDVEYLEWLHARLVHKYGEDMGMDHMRALRRVIQHAKEAAGADPEADRAWVPTVELCIDRCRNQNANALLQLWVQPSTGKREWRSIPGRDHSRKIY